MRGQPSSRTIPLHYLVFSSDIRNVFWDLKLQDSMEILSLQETADKYLRNRCTGQCFVQVGVLRPHLQISFALQLMCFRPAWSELGVITPERFVTDILQPFRSSKAEVGFSYSPLSNTSSSFRAMHLFRLENLKAAFVWNMEISKS